MTPMQSADLDAAVRAVRDRARASTPPTGVYSTFTEGKSGTVDVGAIAVVGEQECAMMRALLDRAREVLGTTMLDRVRPADAPDRPLS